MGEITFDKSVEAKVSKLLETIAKNDIGKVILNEIEATSKTLTFKPRTAANINANGKCNVETKTLRIKEAAPRGTGRGDTPIYDQTGRPVPFRLPTPSGGTVTKLGTGEGSDVEIHFDIDLYESGCAHHGPGSLVDEVLIHELVHALRSMQGEHNAIPVPSNPDLFMVTHDEYDTEEEFLAIVVANVYSSRNGGTQLRAGHRGHFALKPPLNTSAGFLQEPIHNKYMNIYRLTWKHTFYKLAVIPATFNPFAELSRNTARLGGAMTLPKAIYPSPQSEWIDVSKHMAPPLPRRR